MIKEKKINILKIDYDIHQYVINKDYYNIAQKHIPILKETDYFFQAHYTNEKSNLPEFGWKIHISAILNNAKSILNLVSVYCAKNKINFKFLKDSELLMRSLSKNFSRSSSGKFITIYPKNTNEFINIMAGLYLLLKEYKGPFILSDKRYKNCKVLYYRFGRMEVTKDTPKNSNGEFIFKGPNNLYFVDEPQPYYQQPSWISNPILENIGLEENEGSGLKNGRYLIKEVINISNSGGVYKAFDNTLKHSVILKEARPGTVSLSNGMDAVDLRKIEGSILQEAREKKITCVPTIYDNFFEWEHYFISVEEIKGKVLREFFKYLGISKKRNSIKKQQEILNVFQKILSALNDLHSQNITVGDISLDNIIIDHEGNIKFIDLELGNSEKCENTSALLIGTHECRYNNYDSLQSRFQMDYEGIGIVLLNCFIQTESLFSLDKEKIADVIFFCYENKLMSLEIKIMLEKLIFGSQNVSLLNLIKDLDTISNQTYFEDTLKKEDIRKFVEKELVELRNTIEQEYYAEKPNFLITNELNDFIKGKIGLFFSLKKIDEALAGISVVNRSIPDTQYGTLSSLYIASNFKFQSPTNNEINLVYNSLLKNYSIRNGLAGLGLVLLNLEEIHPLTLKIGVEISDLVFQNEYNQLMISSAIEYGFFNGLSGIAYYLSELYKKSKEQIYLDAAEKLIDYIIKNAVNPSLDFLVSDAQDGYTNDGLLGLSGLGIAISSFLTSKSCTSYESYLIKIIEKVKDGYVTNHSIGTGISGIILMLIFVTKNNQLDISKEEIFNLLRRLSLYKVKFRNNNYYGNQNSSMLDNSFYSGSAGVAYMLGNLYLQLKKEGID